MSLLKAFRSKYPLTLLAVLGGVLMWLGWPIKPFPFFLFVGFVPLLFIEQRISASATIPHKGSAFFKYSYLFFLIWNLLTTYWVCFSTVPGGIAAITCNALLMSIPAMAFFFTKRFAGEKLGYLSLVVYYLTFEQFHLNWDLTWPWLTLGNGFAATPVLVQWYEYTGHMGGSVWVLAVNVLVFLGVRYFPKRDAKALAAAAALILLPMLVSVLIWTNHEEKGTDVEAVVVQPNIDPYTEKFWKAEKFIPYELQLDRLLQLSASKITPNTQLVFWPETALATNYDEDQIHAYDLMQTLKNFFGRQGNVHLVGGLDSYRLYGERSDASPTTRFREGMGYYDVFNTAMHLTPAGQIELYHKSKLVPGVEKLPYPGFFKFLGPLAIDLGGTVGSLGSQEERAVFRVNDQIGVAPVICYESVYGDFVTGYVRKGATIIGIITNDAWWGDSPGYKQHLQYGRLRAIENRRSIARSANTGISCFINQRGEILQPSDWWVQAAVRGTIKANSELTFYTRHGDYIGRFAKYSSLVFLALAVLGITRRKKTTTQPQA